MVYISQVNTSIQSNNTIGYHKYVSLEYSKFVPIWALHRYLYTKELIVELRFYTDRWILTKNFNDIKKHLIGNNYSNNLFYKNKKYSDEHYVIDNYNIYYFYNDNSLKLMYGFEPKTLVCLTTKKLKRDYTYNVNDLVLLVDEAVYDKKYNHSPIIKRLIKHMSELFSIITVNNIDDYIFVDISHLDQLGHTIDDMKYINNTINEIILPPETILNE